MPLSLPEIKRPDRAILVLLQKHLDNLTKPPGSLGRLEELARNFGLMREWQDLILQKRAIFTFAADHGVSRAGVSAYPREVTAQMVFNFIRSGAAINVLCRHYGIQNVEVDAGVDYDFPELAGLVSRKVGRGTENFLEGPAMTVEQAMQTIEAGMDLAQGNDLVGTGDMGIGNTTSRAAFCAVFTGLPVKEVVGRGTGIDDDRLRHKTKVIRDALARHKPEASNALDVLAKVGGFEIGAIAGLILGAASR